MIKSKLACAAVVAAASAGGAAPAAPHTATTIESTRPALAVARCFETTADFASFAHHGLDALRGEASYTLRFDRTMLEQVRFLPRPEGGSRIEIILSDRYSARDRIAFQKIRGTPLERCARPALLAATTVPR